jgi:hypothetical protein
VTKRVVNPNITAAPVHPKYRQREVIRTADIMKGTPSGAMGLSCDIYLSSKIIYILRVHPLWII